MSIAQAWLVKSYRLLLIPAIFDLVLTGCQSIGPGSIHRDRLDYAGAIADSWKEQTLLSIIRLRYFDTPTFLDVASVVSSYQLQGEVRFSREVFPSAAAETNRTFGLTGSYTDRPTISYAPLSGDKFVNSLLRPIPPQAVFAMITAGHRAQNVFIHSGDWRGASGADPDHTRELISITARRQRRVAYFSL